MKKIVFMLLPILFHLNTATFQLLPMDNDVFWSR